MISPQFRPIVGGYERAAERLSVALAERGHAVMVITERRDHAWPAQEIINGIQIKRLWCHYRQHLHVITSLTSFMLFLAIKGRRFQVWHVHQYGMHAVLAVTLGKLLHRPVVLKLTSSGSQGLQQATAALPIARIAKYLLQKVDAIVATTRETEAEAIAFGVPEERVHILGNGVDMFCFKPRNETERTQIREKFGITADGIVIFVGRLSKEKNPDGLLQAWKIALPHLPTGWKLLLVGDGPMFAELASYIETEGLTSSVYLTGYQSNVDEWMAAADIYVLPSYWEGLSNTMLEAMASGLPVVSTRVSGSIEIVEETNAGMVVDVGQINKLAEAVVQLVADPGLRRQMGKAGRAVIRNHYSIESVAAKHEQLYLCLLAGGNGNGVGC